MGWEDIFKKNIGRGSGSSSSYFPTAARAAAATKAAAKAAGAKAAPVARVIGSRAAPIIGRVAAGTGAAATATKGAVLGAGVAAGASFVNAIGDPGFPLFIIGLLTFIFNEYLANPVLAVILGSFFMFYSSIFIFKARGIFVTIIFWVWYVVYGGITDPNALIYMILPIVIISMLVHGLVSKIRKEGFGDGAAGEIIGLVPILFFFLDLGLLDFLTQQFGLSLSTFVQNLLLFTPWWALLGLFSTKKEGFLITGCRMAGIAYVFIILTVGVVPEAYAKYSEQSIIPGPGKFIEAKKELQERLPQRENPFVSHMACIFGGEYTELQNCIQKRQEQSELNYLCEKVEEKAKGTPEYDDCLQEQQEKKKQGIEVSGGQDPTRNQPMKAEFIVSQYFPKSSFRNSAEAITNYPIEFKIENPRKYAFEVEFSCQFKKGGETETLPGNIISEKTININSETSGTTIICQGQNLDGSYQLVYEAKLKNVFTKSLLRRAFIGSKNESWKKEWLPRIMPAHFASNQHLSQAPADLARINFAIGNPLENPIIELVEPKKSGLVLSAAVENAGQGKIAAIVDYKLGLEGFDNSQTPCSKQGLNVAVPKDVTKSIYLTTCFIDNILIPDLQNPPKYEFREFEATLHYDYLLTKEIPVEVKVIPS